MERRSGIVGIVVVALALGVAPSAASASSQDVATTRSYVQAGYALAVKAEKLIGPALAQVSKYNAQLASECPNAAAGSPQNSESQYLSTEVAGALWSVGYKTGVGPARAFAKAVKSLQWSNPSITRMADLFTKELIELVTMPKPNLCADVKSWAASGFKTVAPSIVSYDKHAENVELHEVPWRLLAPYEQPSEQAMIARIKRVEIKLEEAEIVTGFKDWDDALETLGLSQ